MTGQTISHYRILEKLGEGGMGVVYKAEDTKLNRTVALKFVPCNALGDAELHTRFCQEAQAAAALSHANVCTVYEIDEECGFLALEFIEGETVQARVRRRPLPIPEALDIAMQAAQGLQAAHERGVVHRDIKGANLMVTPQGTVKIMDFGLARLTGRTRVTKIGTAVGTPAYMSPEQAQGKAVDRRTDLWSLGVVLYEMVAGQVPFRGESDAAVAHSILHEDPEPVTALRAGLPLELDRVIGKALAKDPGERYQHAEDLLVDLRTLRGKLRQESKEVRLAAAAARRRMILAAALAGLALAAIASTGYLAWKYAQPRPETDRRWFMQITDDPGQESDPTLSPDGRSVVYASRAAGNWDIYSLRVGGRNPANLTKDSAADDTQPAFSHDGERIAFRSERGAPSGPGGIFIMGATGESVRRLTEFCYLPAWSPDSKEIACSTVSPHRPDVREATSSQIFAIDVESGGQRLVSGGVQDAVQPSWSPDGRRIAFWGVREGARDIFTVAREGGEAVSVTNDEALDWNPVWSPDGKYIYFSSSRGGAMNLWRIAVDRASGKPVAEPEPVSVPSTYAAGISFSRDGRRLAYASCLRSSNICRADFDAARESVAGPPRPVTQGVKQMLYPSISRDGAWIAFTQFGLQEDLAVVRPDGSQMRRITEDPARDRAPRWSLDGSEIAFMSTRSGRFEIWTIHPDGSGLTQVTEGSPRGGVMYPAWSADGRRLSYNLSDEMGYIVEFGKPWRDQQPQLVRVELPGRSWLWLNDWSHDGGRIAGTIQKPDGGTLGIGAYSLATEKFEQYANFGQFPRWLPDGRRLLFHARSGIFLVDTAGKRTREVLSTKEGDINPYFDLSWDGRTIVFSLESMESDIWIMTAGR